MSVSDPLIKELKGHVSYLHSSEQPIKDSKEELLLLCECLESIFRKGLAGRTNYIGTLKKYDAWQWIDKIADEKFGVPYSYVSSVKEVIRCKKISSRDGYLRLFIRTALVNRCLHVPVQTLVKQNLYKSYYTSTSIIGNEILVELFISLLMICSRIHFELELACSRFLDETWNIPELKKLTTVPCNELGVTVLFVKEIPLITSVLPDSVIDDMGGVSVGDVLDEINNEPILQKDEGQLRFKIYKASGQPILLYIIKGSSRGAVFPPMMRVLNEAAIDPTLVASLSLPSPSKSPHLLASEKAKSVDFLGTETTGTKSDMRQLHIAMSRFLKRVPKQEKQSVFFSFYDLGVKVKLTEKEEVLMEHSFMEITCCGCTSNIPGYFAYISGNKEYTNCKDFICYIFYSDNFILTEKICRSIAQGFKRTLCTV